MSSQEHALPAIASSRSLDDAGAWFWNFLKDELAPYPGRASVVARMTISATLIMIIVMTFRIPYGFLGAIYTMLMTRENPTATLRSGIKAVASYFIATIYTLIGVMMLIDDPLTHFLWITMSLFMAFYLIRIFTDYFTAVGFGFTLAGAIPLWDESYLTVNQRTENTLWLGFAVVVGIVVTVVVEYVFRRVHPQTDLTVGIGTRLRSVEGLLRNIADGHSELRLQKQIEQYSSLGTSRLRRLILRSGYNAEVIGEMSVAIALLGRLVDLAASLQIIRSGDSSVPAAADRERCLGLADQIAGLVRDLSLRQSSKLIAIPTQPTPSQLPLLPEMERTVALITHAFSHSGEKLDLPAPIPVDEEHKTLLVADAFSNPDHLKFAIRGTLATMLAYVTYQGLNWPGLSTSVATCIITALSTIGASRQKQFLRLGGAILGGFVFGMGAQVFILPYLDSITGFTVLFAVVTGISAWLATATPRLSYLGIQCALAFYLINVQEFAMQTSLAIARDRVMGVLLGLLCMWLVFDRLWMRDALQEMQAQFARNLRLLRELIQQCQRPDREEAIKRVIALRDQINEGFNAVKSQSDAVLFEFGPSRRRKLQIRSDFRRWQPTLGILLQVEITYIQYVFERRLPDLPQPIVDAHLAFEEALSEAVQAMADEICEGVSRPAPNVQAAALALRDAIQAEYENQGKAAPPTLVDIVTLTQNLASIIAPLAADIQGTFANPQQLAMHHPELRPNEA